MVGKQKLGLMEKKRMNWISVKDHLPTEEKPYLVTQNCFGYRVMSVARWSNDLHELIENEDGEKGFWDSDPEWGKYRVDNILAWCEVEPYDGD